MKQIKSTIGATLAASVALAIAGCNASPEAQSPASVGKVMCKEGNSCKGQGSCAGVAQGQKHSCKGQNSCGGNTRELTKAECDAIKGTVASN
ncbi:MAG: hypothetical protein MUF64_25785 [Polyangiaceae bacterium]|jgi:hypothetical protein|nr:hypothetical protein [Polyangiaceae bacterium]